MSNTTYIKSGIVCNEYRTAIKILFYLIPYLGKLWRIFCVFGMYTMNLYVPIAVLIIFGSYKPRFSFNDFTVFYDTDTSFTYGCTLTRCSFEINGNKIYSLHFRFSSLS